MIAIKGLEKIPTDCKKCPLVAAQGSPKEPFNPMTCVAIWITTHEIKYCIGGKIRDDCPLVEIVTCKKCKYWNTNDRYCRFIGNFTDEDFYCAGAERR